jgi:cyclopropane fatty-acyl-phospholipid synthase-like methyltransferase
MGFYDDEKTALQYIAMADGYDGRELVEVLKLHLPVGASVLELGMGPGVDLNILKTHFEATGSDYSQFFLDRYRDSCPDSDLIQLDAVELDTQRVFDGVYSNKVLHHLTNEELTESLRRQRQILSDTGLIMHSFWHGTGVDEHHGLKFVYQTEDTLRSIVGEIFNVVDIVVYKEMEDDDSLYVLASV